jgi:hypothetical protein
MNNYLRTLILTLLLCHSALFSQITLTHNIGNTVIPNSMYTCSSGGICWARKFVLSEFGINSNENFTITTGAVGLFSGVNWDTNLQFNIYVIDGNFPTSFTESSLIGSSQVIPIDMGPNITQTINVNFTTPVVVPAGTAMILVEVFQLHSLNSEAHAAVGGTATDNDFSWFRTKNPGCPPYNVYTTTVDLGKPDARFYITVNGTAAILGTQTLHSDSKVVVYPNPVGDVFFIKNTDVNAKIELYNALGQSIAFVKNIMSSGEVSIILDRINRGLYYVKIDGLVKKIVFE